MLVKKLITFICLYVFIVLFPFFGCYNHNDANNTSGNSIDKKINNLNEEYNYLSKTIPDRFKTAPDWTSFTIGINYQKFLKSHKAKEQNETDDLNSSQLFEKILNFNLLSYYLNEAGISHSQIEYITMYFNDLLFDYDNKFLSVIEGEFDTDKITSNIIKLSEEKFTEIEYEKNKQNKIKFSIPKLNIKFYFTSDSKIIIANSEIFEDIEKQKYQKKENIKYIKNLNKVYNESGLWIVYETTPNFPSLAKINLRKIFEGIDYILIKSEYSNKQPDNNPTMEKKSNSNSTAFFELIIVCDDYQTTKDIIDIINNIFYELDKIYHNDPQMMDFLSNISLKTKNNNELIISMDYALENLLYIYDSLSQF